MGKRFRETNISRESWYRKLTPEHKCTWNFLCDECDVAGMWSIDEDAIEFYIGQSVDLDQFMNAVNNGKGRVERFGGDKLFIAGFIEFQYGQLSENCKPHQKIISLLKKYNLYERVCKPYTKGIDTLQEEDKDREEEKEEDKEEAQKQKRRSAQVNVKSDEDPALKETYQQIVVQINAGLDLAASGKLILDFINASKPSFAEPYVDLWNIFASRNNLAKVEIITQKRREKIKVRSREPSFDFPKIIEAIKRNDFYLGKTTDWKVEFDYIINSQDNYAKILERKK